MGAILLLILRAMLGTLAGQIVSAVALGALALWGYGAWEHAQGIKEGAEEVVVTINEQAEEIVEQAQAARKPAGAPGAALRLRQNWCRDCTP